MLLPIGISFYTFMAISYVVDVSRYEIVPSKWLDVSVYLAFFPHLIAGPIVRGDELIPQIRRPATRAGSTRPEALLLIFAGLFKKIVISSFLAPDRRPGLRRAERARGIEVLIAIYAYAIMIYADFSAYSDIAIGVALLLDTGELRPAVRRHLAPGLLAEVAHDALAVAARLPLHPPRGSRHEETRTAINIMITMLLGGLAAPPGRSSPGGHSTASAS